MTATQTSRDKSSNGRPHHLTAREAENVARAIDALIVARISHTMSPGQGGEVAERCHGDLVAQLEKLMAS